VYQAERLNDAVEAVSDVVYGDTREVVITTADGKVMEFSQSGLVIKE